MSVSPLPPPRPGRLRRGLFSAAGILLAAGVVAWAWAGTGMNAGLGRITDEGGRRQIGDFLDRMFPPDLAWDLDEKRPFVQPPLRLAAGAVAITLQISVIGTLLGTIAALLLGFLAAETLTPHFVHHPVKILLALLRSVPVVLLALLFVAAVGLGPFPGVLAIAIHSVGMLGKLFAEECEAVEAGVVEAMDSAGAGWVEKIRYAVWPQVAPQIWSLTLFRLDMNIRDSAVLGLVGVAGIGYWIENHRRAFDYPGVATLVLVTMAVVLAVDQASFHLRRRLK